MPENSPNGRVTLSDFYQRVRSQTVSLNERISYFAAGQPLTEEDLRDYLEDPLAALPPSVEPLLANTTVLLVPFLERTNGKSGGGDPDSVLAAFEAPPEGRDLRSLRWADGERLVVALAIDDMEVAEYHYELYRHLASHIAASCPEEKLAGYLGTIREELSNHMHGEVDEDSWQRKQQLLRRQTGATRDSKALREYARQSFVDTLTLYLHGICCDIDVETGPRQLPSRYLRKRLKLIREMFPPPSGYAVFPEELDR
ncbi:MAG: hypothetical protein R2729_17390 [Bryobacteraceae bacterium]